MKTITGGCAVAFGCILCIHILGGDALAAETGVNWRSAYDLIMRWVNVLILAFLAVKFLKKPLINFLQIRKEDAERTIRRTEARKKAAEEKIQEIRKEIDESQIRFARLEERIAEEGKRRKQEIIEDARQEVRFMLEIARHRAEHQVVLAKNRLHDEILDAAIARAADKLPEIYTPEDDRKWISRLMGIDTSNP